MMNQWVRGVGVLALVAWMSAGPSALGQYRPQQQEAVRELYSAPPELPKEKPWKPWLIAVLCTAGAAAVAFKKPGRTHLD